MRVSLVYNEGAGAGVDAPALQRCIEGQGHRILAMQDSHSDPAKWASADADLVVAAGGDGTVQTVADALVGTQTPFAILPCGVANNVAASFGLTGSLDEMVARWRSARPTAVDIGEARGSWGVRRFVESGGFGLVAEGIRVMDAEDHAEDGDPEAMLAKARRRYAELLRDLVPSRCSLNLDGVASAEELLLLEVLSTCCIGPRLALAPEVSPFDGVFDVVSATAGEREVVARLVGGDAAASRDLGRRRARHVVLGGLSAVHIDDQVYGNLAGAAVELRVLRAAVRVLLP